MEGILYATGVVLAIYLVWHGWFTVKGSGIHHRPYRGSDERDYDAER